jgi:hypothetical protein
VSRNVDDLEDSIYEHLKTVALSKRAILQIAQRIANDYPTDAALLVRVITELTRSADKLLGDTSVLGP